MTRIFLVCGALLLGVASVPRPAHAYWRGGVGFSVGVAPFYYAPPPVYQPPPVYYAPPPVVYAPPPRDYYAAPPNYAQPPVAYSPMPQARIPSARPTEGSAANVPYGGMCYAGVYSCPASGPVGATCACPGIGLHPL